MTSMQNLMYNIELLEKQLFWLNHSFEICKSIGSKEQYTVEQFDDMETLCSRFARSIDFLVRKVYRSIDEVEFESQGTLIDVVNNAHKRNLFDDIEVVHTIKDIRNEIAHEYLDDDLKASFDDVLKYTPILIEMIQTTIKYSQKYKK